MRKVLFSTADVFAINGTLSSTEQQLDEYISKHPPINIKAEDETALVTTPVILLNKSAELLAFHTKIVDILEKNGATFNTPEFTRSGFLPHCTIQKTDRLYKGDTATINTVSLIDMFPDGDWQQRKVIAAFKMQGR